MAQAIEHVSSKHEALISNPSTARKKKKRKEKSIGFVLMLCWVILGRAHWALVAHACNPSYLEG
jgi:hypothetical protein